MMKLISDYPYWLLKNGLQQSYPPINQDISCDVIIVGGGITGALILDRLSREGYRTALIERREICTGSTCGSTALLLYEIDISLVDMIQQLGEEKARRAYKLSHQSIDLIEKIVNRLGVDVGFQRKTSIYLARDRNAAKNLANEARARMLIGLDVEYHNQRQVKTRFGLTGAAALSTRQAAACDPYCLAHRLLKAAHDRGAMIFDRTEMVNYRADAGQCRLTTNRGHCVSAKWTVFATGYESQQMLREKIVDLDNTYALVSEPLDNVEPWNEDWVLWEARDPYLYLRITPDKRLLVGGEDDRFHNPPRRDRSIERKSLKIESRVRKLIPNLIWERAFSWAGTFGKTKDGLPYIGVSDEYPGAVFALCFGGNGITFGVTATDVVSDFIKNGSSPNADLFSFGR